MKSLHLVLFCLSFTASGADLASETETRSLADLARGMVLVASELDEDPSAAENRAYYTITSVHSDAAPDIGERKVDSSERGGGLVEIPTRTIFKLRSAEPGSAPIDQECEEIEWSKNYESRIRSGSFPRGYYDLRQTILPKPFQPGNLISVRQFQDARTPKVESLAVLPTTSLASLFDALKWRKSEAQWFESKDIIREERAMYFQGKLESTNVFQRLVAMRRLAKLGGLDEGKVGNLYRTARSADEAAAITLLALEISPTHAEAIISAVKSQELEDRLIEGAAIGAAVRFFSLANWRRLANIARSGDFFKNAPGAPDDKRLTATESFRLLRETAKVLTSADRKAPLKRESGVYQMFLDSGAILE